jgi:hypothetical protein
MSKDRHALEELVEEEIINLTIRNIFSLDYSEDLVMLPFLLADLEFLACLPPEGVRGTKGSITQLTWDPPVYELATGWYPVLRPHRALYLYRAPFLLEQDKFQ